MLTCPDLDLELSSNHPLFFKNQPLALLPSIPTTLARTPRLSGGQAYASLATKYGTMVSPPSAGNWHGAFNPKVSADDNAVHKIDFDEDSAVSDGSSTVRSLRETLVGADLARARLKPQYAAKAAVIVDMMMDKAMGASTRRRSWRSTRART